MNLLELIARKLAREFCSGYEMCYEDYVEEAGGKTEESAYNIDRYEEDNWQDFTDTAEEIVDFMIDALYEGELK